MAAGYATVTYKMKLSCKHLDWLTETKTLYNQVRSFYHTLLREHTELHRLGSQAILRELEKLSIAGRSGINPTQPLPFSRVPSYFRRSAANGAIGSFQTYLKNHERWEREQNHRAAGLDRQAEDAKRKKSEPTPALEFQASPVFYRGMYKDFTQNSITLKLWTGASWAWVRCRYRGRSIPEGAQLLSPAVVVRKNKAMLHIPVRQEVTDIRPVKERVGQGEPICSVAFTNTDVFAVCSILTVDGRAAASRFIRGGAEYAHHSKRLLERIKSNRAVLGKRFDWTGCNKRYWEHLSNLGDYWAHKASREIVDFCLQNKGKVIALPESDDERMKQIARRAGKYCPIYLSLRIRRYLVYKAWKAGIAVTYVRPGYTVAVCSRCGAWLGGEACEGRPAGAGKPAGGRKRTAEAGPTGAFPNAAQAGDEARRGDTQRQGAEKERTLQCANGHQLNRDLNRARNLGRACLTKLGRRPA